MVVDRCQEDLFSISVFGSNEGLSKEADGLLIELRNIDRMGRVLDLCAIGFHI